MQLLFAPEDWRAFLSALNGMPPCVATMGNFDGFHRGHRALVKESVRLAQAKGLPSLGISFEPHPVTVLRDKNFLPLQSLEQKTEALARAGLDRLLILPFNPAFASGSAAEFCQEVLSSLLQVKVLNIGYDFRLGKDRAGSKELTAQSKEYGMEVHRVEAVLFQDAPISSSRIRDCLSRGELQQANAMLGSQFAVRGLVEHGAGRGGKLLGFPTANLNVQGRYLPQPAIYATHARLIESGRQGELRPGKVYDLHYPEYGPGKGQYLSMTSFGKNPTFGPGSLSLETNILDFDQDIYGQELEVAFLQKMREEIRFSGPEELIARLRQDQAERRSLGDL